MSEWALKRFWESVEVSVTDTGYAVTLDGRGVKTPAKTPLIVPTRALADVIADEWRAQVEQVDPTSMPFTRMANSALDKVTPQRVEVAEMLAAYGDSDLLCYRADSPDELVQRQSAEWDPVLDWADNRFGARLEARTGVMHESQSQAALETLSKEVLKLGPFALAAFHDLVSISGSLVLGLSVAEGHLDADQAWLKSRLDELWQEEQWGPDDEATRVAEVKRAEFNTAARFFQITQVD